MATCHSSVAFLSSAHTALDSTRVVLFNLCGVVEFWQAGDQYWSKLKQKPPQLSQLCFTQVNSFPVWFLVAWFKTILCGL